MHLFNPSTPLQKQADLCEFKTNLVYRVNSRTAKATQRNPVLKNQNKNKNCASMHSQAGGRWHCRRESLRSF